MTRLFILLLVGFAVGAGVLRAHETRPAYLEVRETRPGEFRATWKTPSVAGRPLSIEPEFSGQTLRLGAIETIDVGDASIRTWTFRAAALRGMTLEIRGLERTLADVYVRFTFADGVVESHILRPNRPSVRITGIRSATELFRDEIVLGMQHIAFGTDHLLFVLGLLLIVVDRRMLVKTVTAFTIAHSITLAIATLGFASAPAAPLNAAIALSILFIAPEIVRRRVGATSLTIRRPWLVAFAFGLLHGFGFAGALTSSGVPRADLPLVLAAFNIGVELGQLAFIALILVLLRSFRRMEIRWPVFVARLPEYAIGGLGAYWTIERTALMILGRGD